MKSINKLEKIIAGWLKSAPHLPEKARKWIAINVWWLELIGLIIMIIAGLTLIGLLTAALGLSATIIGAYGYPIVYNGLAITATVLSLGLIIISVAIMALAISPLKALKKRGWDFLFITLLVNCASVIISAIFSFSISSLFSGAVGVVVGAYLLFEIRSFFVAVKTSSKK